MVNIVIDHNTAGLFYNYTYARQRTLEVQQLSCHVHGVRYFHSEVMCETTGKISIVGKAVHHIAWLPPRVCFFVLSHH